MHLVIPIFSWFSWFSCFFLPKHVFWPVFTGHKILPNWANRGRSAHGLPPNWNAWHGMTHMWKALHSVSLQGSNVVNHASALWICHSVLKYNKIATPGLSFNIPRQRALLGWVLCIIDDEIYTCKTSVPWKKFIIDYLISNIMANPPNMWSVPYTFANIWRVGHNIRY